MKTPRYIAIEDAAQLALDQMEQCESMFRDDTEFMEALTALRTSLDMKSKRAKVWVLVMDIENSGISSEVFTTKESALQSLAVYVRENWKEMPIGTAMPNDRDQAIDEYFNRDDADDTYTLEECKVED